MLPLVAPRPAVRAILALCCLLFAASRGHAALSPTPGWTYRSDQPISDTGYSVAYAGDVNGDGYGDLVAGAPRHQVDGMSQSGRVQAFYGSAAGPSATPSWVLDGTQADEFLGVAVAAAGDVNGDGYDDVLVGASGWDNGSLINAGQTRLYAGSAGGLSTTPLWTLSGDQAYAILGGVAGIGDVNGDGYDDIAVSAEAYDNPESYEGRVYVHYGSPNGPSSAPGWVQEGNAVNAAFGAAEGGDVNGDGFADLIVGARGLGRVFVYAGGANGLATTPLSTLTGSSGFGGAVEYAGDVNGDGYGDVAVAEATYDSYAGAVYVFHGGASGVSPTIQWMTTGSGANASYGTIAAAADVNRDGYSDLLTGATGSTHIDGGAWLYVGSASGLSTGPMWSVTERQTGLGGALDAGDVNGDGRIDVIAGATGQAEVRVYYDCAPPPAPTALTITTDGVLSWTAPAGATVSHYNIHRGELGCSSSVRIAEVTGTTYTDPAFASTYYYSVTAVGANGCESVHSNCVRDGASCAPPAILYSPDAVCPNGATGTAAVDNASAYSSWSWTIQNGEITTPSYDPQISFRATGFDPVILSVTVMDSAGCTSSNSTTVPIRSIAPPTILYTPDAVCPYGATGTATVENASGYTDWSWTIENGEITTPSYDPQISFRATGFDPVILRVSVRDAGGCMSSNSTTVPIRSIAPPTILYTPDAVCPYGATGTATVENASGYTDWSWTIENGEITTPSYDPQISFRATGFDPVILRVSVRDAGGCMSSNSTTVPIRSIAPPTILYTPDAVCPYGATGMATVENASAYSRWSWTIENGEITTPSYDPQISFRATGTDPVILRVTVTDAGGCMSSNSTTVPIRSIAPPTVLYMPDAVCPNGATGTATVENASAYSRWSWAIQNGEITTPPYDPQISFRATGSDPVILSVTVTDAGGCMASNSTSVPIRTLSAPSIAHTPSVCANGGSGSARVENASAYSMWSWTIRNGELTSPANNAEVTFRSISNEAVQLSVTVTDSGGCSATASATVPASVIDTPTIAADGPTTFCDGGSVVLTASPAHAYRWSNGATTQAITVDNSATVTVEAFNADGCAATSAPMTITENAPLSRPTITANGPTTFCQGGSVELVANVTGGSGTYAYQWYSTGTPIPGATSRTYVANGNPQYVYVAVTDSLGCTSGTSEAQVLTVQPLPDATITAPASACAGSTQPASAPPLSGATYTWTIAGGTIESTMSNAVFFRAGASGKVTLNVTVTSADGCSSSDSESVAINAPPDATVTTSGSTTFCEGGSVTLTAPAGMSGYQWSNGATSQSIVVSDSGVYSVVVTNANGCSARSADVAVTENANADATITAPAQLCAGATGSASAADAGSGASYAWTIANGTITATSGRNVTFTAGASGNVTLTVTVTNASGCTATGSATVAVSAAPDATITAPAALCAGASGTATAADAGAGASYAWTISGGTITATSGRNVTFTAGASGNVTLTVTVTNASGCTTTGSANIPINAPPDATVTTSGSTTFCEGGSVTLTAPAGMSGYQWSNGATSQSIVVSDSGVYSVVVTNANGCSARSADVAVTENANPDATITAPAQLCAGATGSASAADAGSGASYAWTIANGTITATSGRNVTFTAGASGNVTLTVTVTNASGCTATGSATVAVSAAPDATITAPAALCAGASGTATAADAGAGASYAWTISGGTITSTSGRNVTFTAGASGNVTLTVTVTSAQGCSTTASESVTVNPATEITEQPQSVTVPKNTSTTLSVTAAGSGTVTYQWYRGASGSTSDPIAGATSRTYTTPKLNRGTHQFWVRVTAACGSIDSDTATITAR